MSTPKRFFVENLTYPRNLQVFLEGEEFVHAKTVLRVEVGEEIVLLDNSGKEYSAIVDKIEKSRLSAHITGEAEGGKEPEADIYLICGFLKNADKNEFIVQKAVELGVNKIAFFSSEHSSAYMNANKLERLNRVSREAAKQCLRSRAPEVAYYETLPAALASAGEYESKLFACEFISRTEIGFKDISQSVAIVVGSEGGFSESEYKYAKSLGFHGLTLGKRILRAETAAVSVCALAAYFTGELK